MSTLVERAGCVKACIGQSRCVSGWPDGSCGALPQGSRWPKAFVEPGNVIRLGDLNPQWCITRHAENVRMPSDILTFICPCCLNRLDQDRFRLAIARADVSQEEQFEALEGSYGAWWMERVIPFRPGAIWQIVGGLSSDMTITPSVDASNAGHWHGHITNGVVTP